MKLKAASQEVRQNKARIARTLKELRDIGTEGFTFLFTVAIMVAFLLALPSLVGI